MDDKERARNFADAIADLKTQPRRKVTAKLIADVASEYSLSPAILARWHNARPKTSLETPTENLTKRIREMKQERVRESKAEFGIAFSQFAINLDFDHRQFGAIVAIGYRKSETGRKIIECICKSDCSMLEFWYDGFNRNAKRTLRKAIEESIA